MMKLKQKGLRKKFLTKRNKKNSDSGSITSPEVDLTLEGNNASVFFDQPIKNDLEGDSGSSMTMSPQSPSSPDPDCLMPVGVTDDSGTEDQEHEMSQMFADLIKEVENGNSTDSTLIGDQSLVSSGHVSPVSDLELEEMEDDFMEYKGPTIKSLYQRSWSSSYVCSCDPSSVCNMDVIINQVHISPGKLDDKVDCVKIIGTYLIKICHHPECVQENKNQPLLLCRMCDTQIHNQPGYSGHLVLDSPRKKKPFSPVALHPPDIITSNYSNSDDDESDVEGDVTEEGDVVDGLYIQNQDRAAGSPSPSEIQKKLLKRKKVLRKRLKKQEEDVITNGGQSPEYGVAPVTPTMNSPSHDPEITDGNQDNPETKDVPEISENSIFSFNYQELSSPTRSPVRRQSRIGNDEFFTVRFSDDDSDVVVIAALQNQTLRDALGAVFMEKKVDIRKYDVYVTDSNTPLPMECSTFLLAGATLRVKEKDLDVFSSKPNRSNNGSKSSSKPSKSAGRTARRESAITVPTFLEPPTARQRRGSLQLPFFSKNDGNSGVKLPDDTFGSLRGNKRSNFSIDDTFYSSISPGGTVGFSEGKKIKSQNKLSNLFSPQIKDREKHDQLNELLSNYSSNGLPPLHPLVAMGKTSFNEEIFQLEQSWRNIADDIGELSKIQNDQQEAIWELIETEKSFIKNLNVITDVFKNCLLNIQNNQLLSEIETEQLFSNIDALEEVNCQFWEQHILPVLNNSRSSRQPLNPSLFKQGFISQFHKLFHPYIKWCIDQKNCVDYQRTKYSENELFKTFVVWAEAQPQCKRLKLTDLLAKPMQRLTKYSLLVNAILKKTEDPNQRQDLEEMIEHIDRFVTHVNTQLRNQQEQERYESIIAKIEPYDAIEAPNEECVKIIQEYNTNFDLRAPMPGINQVSRKLLMQSALKLKEAQARMEVDCFLFTDLFLICKSNKRMDKYKVLKAPMRLDRILVHDLKDKGSFLLIYLNEYHVPCTAYTFHANESAVKCWLEYIRKAQNAYNEARFKLEKERLSKSVANVEQVEYTPLNGYSVSNDLDSYNRTDSVDSNEGRFIPNIIKTAATPVAETNHFTDSSREDSSDATLCSEDSCSERTGKRSGDNSPTCDKHTLLNISRSVPNNVHNLSSLSLISDSDPDLQDYTDEDHQSRNSSRRISRTRAEKRYHTADSIQDMNKKDKDSSIHKRLSWNYGMVDIHMDGKHSLRHKTMSTDSIRSIPSSSGVSSTGSLHMHTESDISEEVEHGLSPDCSLHIHHEASSSIDNSDLEIVALTRESKRSKSKSTSDIVQIFQELRTSDPEDGISSVDLPEMTGRRKLTHSQIVKMKKQLLLNSNVEASEV